MEQDAWAGRTESAAVLVRRIIEVRITRREFIPRAALTGISVAVIGCAAEVDSGGRLPGNAETSDSSPSVPAAGTGRSREKSRNGIMTFDTKRLPVMRDVVAPDGSDVRFLLGLKDGGMAHFELPPGQTSTAVAHRTVEEIWFFLTGRGELWRKQNDQEEVVAVEPNVCLTIPLGTHFQFRSFGDDPLAAVGITMPTWPGEGEAYEVKGPWDATVPL